MALHVDKQTYFWLVTPMCKTPKKQLEELNVILNPITFSKHLFGFHFCQKIMQAVQLWRQKHLYL